MFEDVRSGDTLYSIAAGHGVAYQNAIILPGGSTDGVRLGEVASEIAAGDKVFLAAGKATLVQGPTDTLYSIARGSGLDNWQDLKVLRGDNLYDAASLPYGVQPGDRVYSPATGNCCGVADEGPTPTGNAEQAANETGSGQAVEASTTECDDKRVIVIDPGHGGTQNVSGSSWNNATSVSGPLEKELTLKFAGVLKEKLETEEMLERAKARGFCELEVFLTREDDSNMTPTARRNVAANNSADIFLSIHFNGSAKESSRGPETWIRNSAEGSQSNQSEDRSLATAVHQAAHNVIQSIEASSYTVRGVRVTTIDREEGISVLRDPGKGLSGKMCKTTLLEAEFITNRNVDRLFVSGENVDDNIALYMTEVAKALIGELE